MCADPRSAWSALLVGLTIVLCAQSALAQQVSAPRPTSATDAVPPGLRIVDRDPVPRTSLSHFTIVGAVERSGVYTSGERTIPLSRLIQAAGGFAPGASSNVRVIRGGRPRLQLHCHDPAHAADAIYADDVVVVVPRPEALAGIPMPDADPSQPAFRVIPVACLGLAERPIVLPLDPAIQTVTDLNRRLLQPAQTVEHVQVLDPYSRPQMSQLVPGTVVLFDARHLDRIGLRSTTEFPPAVSLESATRPIVAKSSPAAPATLPPPVNSSVTAVGPTEEFPSIPVPADLEDPSKPAMALPLFPAEESQIAGTSEVAPLPEPPTITPVAVPTAADLFREHLAQEAMRREGEHSAGSAPPTLLSEQNSVEDSRTTTTELSLPVVAEPTPALVVQNRTASLRKPTAPPPPAVIERSSPMTTSTPGASSASAEVLRSSSQRPEVESAPTLKGALLAIGCLLAVCVAGTFVWSKWDFSGERSRPQRSAVPEQVAAHGASTIEDREKHRPDSFPSAARSKPMASQTISTNCPDRLGDVLGGALPLIEEAAPTLANLHLHGEAVGHRRLILHEAHPTLAGMHFGHRARHLNPEPVMANAHALSERQLRQQLRDVFQPSPDTPQPHVETRSAAVDGDHADFDCPDKFEEGGCEMEFSPETFADRPEHSIPIESPGLLERVLRTLDREKRR